MPQTIRAIDCLFQLLVPEYQPSILPLWIFTRALRDQQVRQGPREYRWEVLKLGAVGVPSVYGVQQRIHEIVEERLESSSYRLLRTAEASDIVGTCVWEQGGLGGTGEDLEWPLAMVQVFSGNQDRSALENTLRTLEQAGFLRKRGRELYLHRSIDLYVR